jgi:hypothetical protein
MDRDLLYAHFQQFGRVVRIYLSMKRNSCTVHFDSHVSIFLRNSRLFALQVIVFVCFCEPVEWVNIIHIS